MRTLLLSAWALSGCLGSQFEPGPGGPPGPGGGPDLAHAASGNPDMAGVIASGLSGPITSDTTLTGLTNVTSTVTIGAGVTVTVSPGAMLTFAAGAGVVVSGTLKVQGTSASGVQLQPTQQGSSWGGISVQAGGTLDLAYATLDQALTPISCAAGSTLCKADHTALTHYTGVGMQIASPATFSFCKVELGGSDGILVTAAAGELVTVTDSTFHSTGGDAIVVNGGDLTFQHNTVYGDVSGGTPTGQHCACHFSSTGTFLVDHNDFYNSAYALMASDMGAASKVNQNNFYSSTNLYGTANGSGINPAVDLTNNYWGGGAPPAITGNPSTSPYATTKIAGTGPR